MFLSLRAYMVTMLKDGGEIRIYSFMSAPSSSRPTHVATPHHPPPHDHRVLLELTTATGPFLTRPAAGVSFAVHNARARFFTIPRRTRDDDSWRIS